MNTILHETDLPLANLKRIRNKTSDNKCDKSSDEMLVCVFVDETEVPQVQHHNDSCSQIRVRFWSIGTFTERILELVDVQYMS